MLGICSVVGVGPNARAAPWVEADIVALKSRARAPISDRRALVRVRPDDSLYRMHLAFVVERGCEQTFSLIADPRKLPTLFPRIKAFDVRRRLDDGFLADAKEGFIGLPMSYPVRTVLEESGDNRLNPKRLRIHSVAEGESALTPSGTVDVHVKLTPTPHPQFCEIDFKAQTQLPGFVPDAAIDFAVGYSEDEIAYSIREALGEHPPWPNERLSPLLTPKARRLSKRQPLVQKRSSSLSASP